MVTTRLYECHGQGHYLINIHDPISSLGLKVVIFYPRTQGIRPYEKDVDLQQKHLNFLLVGEAHVNNKEQVQY